MCDCVNVDMGTYDNVVDITPPIWSSKSVISIDKCLFDEILDLWHFGIVTVNSCCGHNKLNPTILVSTNSIQSMRKMGYEPWENPSDKYRMDGFYAKSVERITE